MPVKSHGIGEAEIIVGGVPLSFGQSMAVRVAVGNFLMELMDDEFSKAMGPVAHEYRERLNEVQALLIKDAVKE